MSDLQKIVVLRERTGNKDRVYTLAHAKGVVMDENTWNGHFSSSAPLTLQTVIENIPGEIDSQVKTLSLTVNADNTIQLLKGGQKIGTAIPLSGGIGDAPHDGNSYVRKNSTWTKLDLTPLMPLVHKNEIRDNVSIEMMDDREFSDAYALSASATKKILDNTVGWVKNSIDTL